MHKLCCEHNDSAIINPRIWVLKGDFQLLSAESLKDPYPRIVI